MRKYSVEDNLGKHMKKRFRKDKVLYYALMNKMDEILNVADVAHYKNLRSPLQDFKRVHVKGSFVLIFKYIPSEDRVIFFDFGHHDNIYN